MAEKNGQRSGQRIHLFADVVLMSVAVGMLLIMVSDRKATPAMSPRPPATVPENWAAEIETGIRVGPRDAALTVIEFMDFQCPFCARWAARLDSLMTEYPESVQLVVHHFPLSRHAQALQAAVTVECAHGQGRFAGYQRALFAHQSELGEKPWVEIAEEAGVPDLGRFDECARQPPDSFPRIQYGLELGREVGVRGTPTVWINGEAGQPTLRALREMIREVEGSR